MSTLNRGGVHLVVDGRGVTFMDSSGINALVRARERVLPTVEEARDCISRPAVMHSCGPDRGAVAAR